VESVRGAFVFPDANAHGQGPDPQWCYTVVFDGPELWGPSADPRSTVSVDAFEPYLEPVT
jgi:nitrile hydratase